MSDWDDIVAVTAAQYAKAQQGLAPILEEETRLRGELARLDHHDRSARDGSAETQVMRGIGADLAWNAWLARKRRQLNMELARVLARKESRLARIRHAHARREVATMTADKLTTQARARRSSKALAQAIEIDVLRRSMNQ